MADVKEDTLSYMADYFEYIFSGTHEFAYKYGRPKDMVYVIRNNCNKAESEYCDNELDYFWMNELQPGTTF